MVLLFVAASGWLVMKRSFLIQIIVGLAITFNQHRLIFCCLNFEATQSPIALQINRLVGWVLFEGNMADALPMHLFIRKQMVYLP